MKSVNNVAKRIKGIVVLSFASALLFGACSNKEESKEESKGEESAPIVVATNGALSPMMSDSALGWAENSEAGMSWAIPDDWTVGPDMPMRAGTYYAAAAEGDSEPAECRVNFFGAGQGGAIDENVARWAGQMEVEGEEGKAPTPIVEQTEVNGLPVAIVEISGVYLSKVRPMAQEFTRKSGFKMFAAISTAPAGTVFFKMVGEVNTMEANREKFRLMIGSFASGS